MNKSHYHIFALTCLIAACSTDDEGPNSQENIPTQPPALTTNEVETASPTDAVSGGNITESGTSGVIQRGVCWSTAPQPTLADSFTIDGEGTGGFTSAISDLTPDAAYNVRAYALNSTDTAYGNVQSFTAGQNINPALFNVTEAFAASAESVDFSVGETAHFTAEFNFQTEWIIEIRGTESGALHFIDGFGDQLTADNALWTGNTTELPIFGSEPCEVILRLPDHPNYGDTLTVNVAEPKVHDGILFADFETPLGAHGQLGDFEFELSPLTGRRNNITAGQGEYYYFMEGTDDAVENFFVGLLLINSSITGNTYAPVPTTSPEDLYFNFMLWHDGSPHCMAGIQFWYDANSNGIFDDLNGGDEVFEIDEPIPMNHTGWQHFSHPMSETGISAEQLEKLVAVRVILFSDLSFQSMPPQPVRFGIDYLMFSEGGPLEL